MADPFSVAGSAVGVISLGLVACKELYSFIDDARSAEDKAEAIRNGLDRLENHLEQLEIQLSKLSPTSAITSTSTGVAECATALSRIKQALPSAVSSNDSKLRQQFRILKLRLSYPFKKDDLEYLRSLVGSIQQDLQTAQLTVVM